MDALGTAILMGKTDVVNMVIDHIRNIDFSKTDSSISVFETTIRYLGGMLSAYDLLSGPFSHVITDKAKIEPLVEQDERIIMFEEGAKS